MVSPPVWPTRRAGTPASVAAAITAPASVQAIDSVFGQIDDVEGLKRWAEQAKALGFEGMGCVHPRQIQVIHDAFSPSVEQLERARRIVAAFEKAEAAGLGVVSLGSKMIDRPVVLQALRLVRLAESLAKTEHDG